MQTNTAVIRVVLVDDDAEFQFSVASALKGTANIHLESVCSTLAQGLNLLKPEPVDILICNP